MGGFSSFQRIIESLMCLEKKKKKKTGFSTILFFFLFNSTLYHFYITQTNIFFHSTGNINHNLVELCFSRRG
jgi:hypothetical protein